MNRLIELLLGLDDGFLGREGAFALSFNPAFPFSGVVPAWVWNGLLIAAAVALVAYVYRRDGRPGVGRKVLGGLRLSLLLLLIAMLNRPALTLTQVRQEPSVVAVMIDTSASMAVRDVEGVAGTRLEAAVDLAADADLLQALAEEHELRFYRYDADALALPRGDDPAATLAALRAEGGGADGQTTQLAGSVRSVLRELQGQNVAGVVVLGDGQDTPRASDVQAVEALREAQVPVLPVAVGAEEPPPNVDVVTATAQEVAFAGDIVNVSVGLRADDLPAGRTVTLRLADRATGTTLTAPDGSPAEVTLAPEPGELVREELQLRTEDEGTLEVLVEAVPVDGELTEDDNRRPLQISVLDAQIKVLYVDGYPRWEYRYLKQELTRDRTIDLSVLLTSADPGFPQGGDVPIRRFPESMEEMLAYDVVLIGDVDPRQFSDFQLELIRQFVGDNGGGFGMVAGPRFAPGGYVGTPAEQVLPVDATGAASLAATNAGGDAFRIEVTPAGEQLGMFRFFGDLEVNRTFLAEGLQELYWFADGVTPKPGVAQVLAVHPEEKDAAGRGVPLLVVGRYGAGRTLYSGIDDTWRWRYYTGEGAFNTFWVQSLRYLARGRKLGQRTFAFAAARPSYELGDRANLSLEVLDGRLLERLGDSVDVTVRDEAGTAVDRVTLQRGEARPDTFTGGFDADRAGTFTAEVEGIAAGDSDVDEAAARVPVIVDVPALELARPQVDAQNLRAVARETGGQVVPLAEARASLPGLLPSAAREVPIVAEQALWDAPLALVLFVVLVTAEWVSRKLRGML